MRVCVHTCECVYVRVYLCSRVCTFRLQLEHHSMHITNSHHRVPFSYQLPSHCMQQHELFILSISHQHAVRHKNQKNRHAKPDTPTQAYRRNKVNFPKLHMHTRTYAFTRRAAAYCAYSVPLLTYKLTEDKALQMCTAVFLSVEISTGWGKM